MGKKPGANHVMIRLPSRTVSLVPGGRVWHVLLGWVTYVDCKWGHDSQWPSRIVVADEEGRIRNVRAGALYEDRWIKLRRMDCRMPTRTLAVEKDTMVWCSAVIDEGTQAMVGHATFRYARRQIGERYQRGEVHDICVRDFAGTNHLVDTATVWRDRAEWAQHMPQPTLPAVPPIRRRR